MDSVVLGPVLMDFLLVAPELTQRGLQRQVPSLMEAGLCLVLEMVAIGGDWPQLDLPVHLALRAQRLHRWEPMRRRVQQLPAVFQPIQEGLRRRRDQPSRDEVKVFMSMQRWLWHHIDLQTG
jgi:hypothetical protein